MLDIRLLGGFAVQVDGTDVPEDAWRLRKARALVKLLALAPERRLHREQVVELLWPDRDDARAAANNLHQALYAARRALERPAPTARRSWRCATTSSSLDGDRGSTSAAFEARDRRGARPTASRAAYEAALALYAGELLPEDRYEDWTAARRESLRELHLGCSSSSPSCRRAGDDAAVEALQRALVLEDPLHEARAPAR